MEKILIVDDDQELRDMLNEYLTEKGYQVTMAWDGSNALSKIQNEKFNTIILDLKMPKINGLDCLKGIRECNFNNSTPVIVLSGNFTKDNITEMAKLKKVQLLAKPIDLAKLGASLIKAF